MTLDELINDSKVDARELKRALVVKVDEEGVSRRQIKKIFNVIDSYISRWCSQYNENEKDASSLLLNYKGSRPYLSADQKSEIKEYLEEKESTTLPDFKSYIKSRYNVVFKSDQSYYDLLKMGDMSWKKTQKKNPESDRGQIKKELKSLRMKLGKKRASIESGETVVLLEDECHFCWGDALGYTWGKKGRRTEIPITNEKIRQTYFGCINIVDGKAIAVKYPKGDGENSVRFLKHIVSLFTGKKIILLWDKATYHRCEKVKDYLKETNKGLSKKDWKLTLELLPTAAPEENPMETIWLKGKNFVRSMCEECKTFLDVTRVFEKYISSNIFSFEKMNNFGKYSKII